MPTPPKSQQYCRGERSTGKSYVQTRLRLFNWLVQAIYKNKSRFRKEAFAPPDYCGLPLELTEQLYPDTLAILRDNKQAIVSCKTAEETRVLLVDLLLGEFGT